MESRTPWFLHVDLDAFFASVEQLDHPEYKGKPVIVGGLPQDKRSVVSTASYEARKFGVHSAMPTYMAYKLCPQGIFVYGRMKRYAELSYQIMSIFKEYSPDVQQMSIDEAFIDITGTEKLFGPPEETAMKIKAHVKKNTGLTVSVGLATTKYLAKIASGFSKPDGFYFVKPGTEQEFMLNLPLEKVWGVGKKTLEALKKSGINSTRDIYDKSYDALDFLFGKNTANFLYNVVRGIDTINFGHEAKNHSLSAERTFEEDITDRYLAETQLMELCQGVLFRLIREESFSRTAFVKIRYDDFSTVSIQETTDRSILTLDSYFEIIKRLFEKKYENGRGIRLLGVGFENIEKVDRPYQQDLFSSSNEKKQAVEKAIINLEKKHPEISIKKARTFSKKHTALLLFLLSSLFFKAPQKIYADSVTKNTGAGALLTDSFVEPPVAKDSQSLFSYDINDKDKVEFLVSGYWQAKIITGLKAGLGNSSYFTLNLEPPVFTQEIDISTWILLNQKWYFETDFADGFEKNTIAMGYKGNGYLQSVRLSNRGISMPSVYSAQTFNYGLAGGNNQAPGISLHFVDIENGRWSGDFIVRYDMTKTNNATFYGKNSVTDFSISPSDFIYGKTFIFPQNCSSLLTKIDSIYVENKKGTFTDKNGKKYKKLSSADYTIIPASSKLTFAADALTSKQNDKIPSIIVTFTDSNCVSSIISATGNYSDAQSFAGQIQSYFNLNTDTKIELSDYSYNLETKIENTPGLLIQNSILFSPFLCANIYDCGLYSLSDLFIQSATSEKKNKDYSVEQIFTNSADINNNFLYENHLYAQVSNNNYSDKSLQKPENRYPFADYYPEMYLNLPFQKDLEILVRNYSEISDYFIDTNAIEGTVQVYINNTLDYNAVYNPNTGIVYPSKNVSQTDKVYILWQEDASDYTGGAVSIGSGLLFNFSPSLTADLAITSRWPVFLNNNYSTVDSPSAGFAAITAGVLYKNSNLIITDKASFSVNSENSSDNLLVLEQKNNIPQTYYLGNEDGYITKAVPYLSGFSTILKANNNCTVKAHGGKTDTGITGYKIPLQFDFSGNSGAADSNWATLDIHLENGTELRKASTLEFAVQMEVGTEIAQNIDVYLQLGVNAGDDFYGEDSQNIPTWKISGTEDLKVLTPLNLTSQKWQTVLITLSDDDRAKLSSSCDARLVVVQKNSGITTNQNGIIYAGPYEPKTQSFFLSHDKSITFSAYNQISQKLPSIQNLNLTQGYQSELKWFTTDEEKAKKNSKISAVSYFDSADFSKYQTINFDFAATKSGEITITLSDEKNTAVSIVLNDLSQYTSSPDSPEYHTLSISIPENKLYIDSKLLDSSLYVLNINKNVIPDKLNICIDLKDTDTFYPKGFFNLGTLYYSHTNVYLRFQNYASVDYKKEGDILKIKDYSLIKDANLFIESCQTTESVTAASNAGITFADIRFEADINSQLDAGHKVQTTGSFPEFINFAETYRFNKSDENLSKTDSFAIDLSKATLPFTLNFTADAKNTFYTQFQNANLASSFTIPIKTSTIGIAADYSASQRINALQNPSLFDTSNYFESWYDISKVEFSTGYENAALRNQIINAKLFSTIAPLNFEPVLTYSLESQYQNLSETTLKDIQSLSLELPFKLKTSTFSLKLARTGDSISSVIYGGTYISDANNLASAVTNNPWLYTSIPFYDLFNSNLLENIKNSTNSLQITNFESLYELSWRRRLTNTLADLFIPSYTSFAFSRNIKTDASTADLYQIKCEISNTAINCFGKQSLKPLFNWYNQDEFLGSLTGIIKLPSDQLYAPQFTISAYQQVLFYLNKESVLKTGIDFILETNLNWNARTTFIWARPGKSSFILDASKLFIKKIQKTNFDISREDIFNFSIGQKDGYLSQTYEITHNTDFAFLKYYSITTGLGASLFVTEKLNSSLTFTLSVGGKIVF